jgi:hypothetical protein
MIFHALTAVLVLLKVLGIITVSWWLVLAPSLFMFGILLLVLSGALAAIIATRD